MTNFDARYAELVAQREAGLAATAELARFDALIGSTKPTKPAKKTSKKAITTSAPATTPGSGPGRHPKGKASAQAAIEALLVTATDGMTLGQLTERVQKAGYKTDAKNLSAVVYQALLKMKKAHRVINDKHSYKLIAA